jgi:hypothetical protein
MFATIRRYESVDQSRTSELFKTIDETVLPKLSELPGFSGFYLIDARTETGCELLTRFRTTSRQADDHRLRGRSVAEPRR